MGVPTVALLGVHLVNREVDDLTLGTGHMGTERSIESPADALDDVGGERHSSFGIVVLKGLENIDASNLGEVFKLEIGTDRLVAEPLVRVLVNCLIELGECLFLCHGFHTPILAGLAPYLNSLGLPIDRK